MFHLSALCFLAGKEKDKNGCLAIAGALYFAKKRKRIAGIFYYYFTTTFHTRFLVCYRALTGDPASTGGAARSAGPNGAPRQVLEISIEGNCSAWGRG